MQTTVFWLTLFISNSGATQATRLVIPQKVESSESIYKEIAKKIQNDSTFLSYLPKRIQKSRLLHPLPLYRFPKVCNGQTLILFLFEGAKIQVNGRGQELFELTINETGLPVIIYRFSLMSNALESIFDGRFINFYGLLNENNCPDLLAAKSGKLPNDQLLIKTVILKFDPFLEKYIAH